VSRWDEALWGVDRWPALVVADLLQQPPSTDIGVPTGLGDWKLSVEILLPADQLSVWGVGVWGEAQWNTYGWHDLTPWVRGLEWTRGADEPYGRPRIGELTVTLDSNDNRFSPWNPYPHLDPLTDDDGSWLTDSDGNVLYDETPNGNPAASSYFGPGTIIRVGVRSATDTRGGRGGWLPQITCIVDSWGLTYADPTGVDLFVDVTAVEMLRDLSQIDENALPGLVGGGEGAGPRFERLLDAAEWRYGILFEAQNILGDFDNAYPLQSTDMAGNRLAECYLVADSSDTVFRTDRTGAALVTNPEYVSIVGPADPRLLPLVEFSRFDEDSPRIGFLWFERTVGDTRYVPYQVDSFASAPDDNDIVNDARFARAGGSQQVYEQDASISRYGRRTLVRNDFLNTTDAAVQLIAQYVTIRRGLNVLRVSGLTVETSDRGTEAGLCVLAADLYSAAVVYPPSYVQNVSDQPVLVGYIANLTHRVTPRNGGALTWQTTFGFDTRTVFDLPGAQLPAT
jgi:hypothetical protein